MSEQVVAVAPDGSARTIDVQTMPLLSVSTGATNAATVRNGGGPVNLLGGSASNWGLGGETPTLIAYLSASCYRIRQGAISSDYRIPLVCAKPTQITSWDDGLYTLGIVMAWPTNTAAVENGLVFGFQSNLALLRPVSTANQGFAIYNESGVITFAMRGPTGLQTTPLAGTVAQWNKVKVELRHATKDNDATVKVFMNDEPTASLTRTSADANFPVVGATSLSAMQWGVGTADAVGYCNFRNVRFSRGPNSIVGA